jgi:alginate O-acetyltransferase complex protein AlgI
MMPQIAAPRTITTNDILQGVYWVLLGFFLKCVVADRVAPIADYNFSILEGPNRGPLAALNGILGFTLQIYGDFAGYTYIALGTARLMGFQLQRNFLAPYLATSLQDFWRRWHVTLSFWLRDYLYVPLGGSRRGTVRTHANLLLTMALGGLWHGASWNFVIWGIYHGCGLAIQRAVSPYLAWVPNAARSIGGWALTLLFVMFGWVLFRASSMSEFTDILGRLTHAGPVTDTDMEAFLVLLAFSVIVILTQRIEEFDPIHAPKMSELAQPVRVGAFALMFLAVFAVGFGEYRFIYFQF